MEYIGMALPHDRYRKRRRPGRCCNGSDMNLVKLNKSPVCFLAFAVVGLSNCVTSSPVSSTNVNTLGFYDPIEDFAIYSPNYFKRKKSAKERLKAVDKLLLQQEKKSKDTTCARQMLRELRWINSYTAEFSKFDARIDELEAIAAGKKPAPDAEKQSSVDGSWGSCHEEWFFKLDVSSDALDDLVDEQRLPQYPVKFMDRINSPEKLTSYLDSILISDVVSKGKDNRKELNYSVSAFLRTIFRNRPANYEYDRKLKDTLRQYLITKWQNPETGYWGGWYRKDGNIVKTDDLSITFHIVSYLKGDVPYLEKIATTTYLNRNRPYPFGLMEEGNYTNHHNYDAVKLFRYGWDRIDTTRRKEISTEINKMVDWCLSESLQDDGSFLVSEADDSFADAFYFGVSFLDEVGFFNSEKKFWTVRQFPKAGTIKEKIRKKIVELKSDDYMLRNALEKLNG